MFIDVDGELRTYSFGDFRFIEFVDNILGRFKELGIYENVLVRGIDVRFYRIDVGEGFWKIISFGWFR